MALAVLTGGAAANLWSAQSYTASCMVLQVEHSHKTFIASCKEISGYMEAMVMPIPVRDEKQLDGLNPGTMVDFTLVVTGDDAYAENVKLHHFQSTERDPFEARGLQLLENFGKTGTAAREVAVGEPVPDFTLTDQTGAHVSLSQFAGKVVAAAFVYTSCPLPNYCFRLSNNLGRLQQRFAERMGRDLILICITIDPARDTPAVLAKYAATWKADPRWWHFLTGAEMDVRAVCHRFGVNFWPDEGALTHSLHTIVIDRKGKLAANFEGNEFSAGQLGDFVETQMRQP